MNYERLYLSLVNAALEREYPEADEYENHHIVPRSERADLTRNLIKLDLHQKSIISVIFV